MRLTCGVASAGFRVFCVWSFLFCLEWLAHRPKLTLINHRHVVIKALSGLLRPSILSQFVKWRQKPAKSPMWPQQVRETLNNFPYFCYSFPILGRRIWHLNSRVFRHLSRRIKRSAQSGRFSWVRWMQWCRGHAWKPWSHLITSSRARAARRCHLRWCCGFTFITSQILELKRRFMTCIACVISPVLALPKTLSLTKQRSLIFATCLSVTTWPMRCFPRSRLTSKITLSCCGAALSWPPCSQCALAAATTTHLQLLFRIYASQLLMIDVNALTLQHDIDPSIAKPPAIPGNTFDCITQFDIILSFGLIPNTWSIHL